MSQRLSVTFPLALAAWAAFPSGCAHSPAQPAADSASVHPTGLVRPTEGERAAMEQTLINTGEVKPNALGLERINAERAKRGLPPLTVAPATPGTEVVPAK